MFGVEANSFLPDDQRNGCDLARQRQACHLWPDPLGHERVIKLFERAGLGGGQRGSALEQVFEIVIVIAVQPADRDRLLRASRSENPGS